MQPRLNLKRKRFFSGSDQSHQLDSPVSTWFNVCRSKHIPITGPLICEYAKKVAGYLGLTDFKESEGWLSSFKERHCIRGRVICGESAEANLEVVEGRCQEDTPKKTFSIVMKQDFFGVHFPTKRSRLNQTLAKGEI